MGVSEKMEYISFFVFGYIIYWFPTEWLFPDLDLSCASNNWYSIIRLFCEWSNNVLKEV